jgi:hypothetical protein
MEYDITYINIKYALINSFLINVDKNVLDISYSVDNSKIIIQVVLLKDFNLSDEVKNKVRESLNKFNATINEIHIAKEQFNENKEDWAPHYYQWLNYLLFSKAEVL